MPVWFDAADSKSQLVHVLNAWWNDNRGDRDLPDRDALDPCDLKPLLPHLLISDAEHDPFRVRYRLVGTMVADVTGFNFTGRYLDELISADPAEPWMEHYRAAYSNARPLFGSAYLVTASETMLSYEFGIFPLRNGRDAVEQFIGIEDYFGLVPGVQQVEPWKTMPPSKSK